MENHPLLEQERQVLQMDARIMQIALEGWGAVLILICILSLALVKKTVKKRNYILLYMLVLDLIFLVSDMLAYIFQKDATAFGFVMTRITNLIVFAVPPSMGYSMVRYMSATVEMSQRESRFWHISIGSIGVAFHILLIVSQFTNLFYYFDESNTYHRNRFFWITVVLGGMILVLIASMIIRFRKQMPYKEGYAFAAYVILPTVSNVVQFFYYGISFNTIAITIAMLLIFLVHIVEQSKRINTQSTILMEQRLTIADQGVQLAEKHRQLTISQIRPHFVFNVLGTIEQLCKTDPVLAADATHHFSKYLRTNINTLSRNCPVPFSEEMQHVRAYVWLEKMRFDDDLLFREDIETEDFCLPVLSLQPLVENSIKHGLMKKADGAVTITISTREQEDHFEIIVADDGAGFDTAKPPDDDRIHVGVTNVKERIRMMSHGEMNIESSIGEGTVITIRIPKNQSKGD